MNPAELQKLLAAFRRASPAFLRGADFVCDQIAPLAMASADPRLVAIATAIHTLCQLRKGGKHG